MSVLLPLVAEDLQRIYGDHIVLRGVSLVANPGHRLGVVGENGAGKSTLLRLLAGVERPDSGEVTRPLDLGYLAQEPAADTSGTVGEVLAAALAPLHEAVSHLEVLAGRLEEATAEQEYADTLAWAELHGAWDADRRAHEAAGRLGLAGLAPGRRIATLSGGERTRLAMAALITRRPECVVLDEPTNHLDAEGMELLEEFLLDLPGVVIVASHDRALLDRVCDSILDLDASHFGVDGLGGSHYTGDFSTYLHHKRAARTRWETAFSAQQDELKALRLAAETTARQVAHDRLPKDGDKFIYNFKGENVQATIRRRVRDVESRIRVIEENPIPRPAPALSFTAPLASPNHASAAVRVEAARVDGRLCVERLDVKPGDHLLVTGPNGSGKSTLLAVLAGRLPLDSGTADVTAARTGWLPQTVRFSRPERTAQQVFEALTSVPVPLADLGLLHAGDLERPVGVLSNGQQRRLALAVLVANSPDLLLLDEPTNSISLVLASELEEAVGGAAATVVLASHDRWLRNRWTGPEVSLSAP
ncbi:MAG TPA: ABC-F family ATP-binding cassette domain-containing protein [Nocardioidaceae bacterium]|nr:ABC-F family ATP-binding cassette domain-containing protein [Nocardioidaceae bacterium]